MERKMEKIGRPEKETDPDWDGKMESSGRMRAWIIMLPTESGHGACGYTRWRLLAAPLGLQFAHHAAHGEAILGDR
jgi:hypothetical protein